MKRIHLIIVALIVFSFSVPYAYGASRKKTVKIPSLTNVVSHIDEVAGKSINAYLEQDSVAIPVNPEIEKYILSLPKKFDRESIYNLYENRMTDLSETGNVDSLLTVCVTALQLGENSLAPMAFEGIVQVMGAKGDAPALEKALTRMAQICDAENVAELRKTYNDILNPTNFADEVQGVWVSANLWSMDYRKFPYFIFKINDITNNDGISLINIPGETSHLESTNLHRLINSQIIGGQDGYLDVSFGTENLKVGNSSFAEQGFQMTRELRAKNRATIQTAKTSTANKIGATLVTELTTTLLDALFMSSAQSYKQVAALNLKMEMKSPVCMIGRSEYYNYRVNTSNMGYTPSPLINNYIEFCKWEPEDGVYFVDSKNKVYSVTPASELDLSEYNSIMYKYSYKRAKYWVPTAAGIIGGIGLMTGGIIMGCNSGTDELDNNGNKKINESKLWGGITMMIIGEVAAISIPCLIYQHRVGNRTKELTDLNDRNRQKLQMKIAPALLQGNNKDDIALGLGASITF